MTSAGRRGPILHATDFSPGSAPAFAQAVAWAGRERAGLVVLHVRTPPSPFVSGKRPPASYLELEARARAEADRRLAALVARARRAGLSARSEMAEGAPAPAIVRAARRHRVRAIVIGTHGRTGLGRVLMGSVAQRVLATAGAPVLTVRAGGRG